MRDLFKEYKPSDKNYLILGKGPSLDTLQLDDLGNFCSIGLNHVCRDIPVDVAHIIDIDVVDQLGEKLLTNCQALFMPYYPHLGFRPHGFLTLDQLSRTHPILKQMQDRIYGYNLSTASQMLNLKWNDSPIVWASFFSAEAVVNLLAKLGVKRIRTIGVDGAKGQSSKFQDLQNINTNGYDAQWRGIQKSIKKYSLDYSPLGVDSPIRIFVGCGDQQLIPAMVLKHSILKHATMSTEVTFMNEWTHPMPKDPRNRPRTPFSFQRFMIPEKCGYQGHAIYMDSDMLVFGDVKDIWTADIGCRSMWTMRNDDVDKHRAKYSVFLMSCGSFLTMGMDINTVIDKLDRGIISYDDLVFNFSHVIDRLDGFNPDWNSLEEYTEGETKLLHYTEFYNQPWHANKDHKLGYLWYEELKEAVKDGSISRELVETHVKNGWIFPKCLEVLDANTVIITK